MAEAVEWLWRNRQNIGRAGKGGSDRRAFCIQDTPIVVLSRRSRERIATFIAGPNYQQTQWFEPLFRSLEFRKVSAGIRDPDGAQVYGNAPEAGTPATMRYSSATGLPWDITLISSNLEADVSQFAQRRRFMMLGLGLLALLVMTTSYLIGRAISRELAAARLQSDFVSAVSHEFRTPLTSMRQFTEMLVENESLPEAKRHTYYQAQERATRRLSRLVESLLDFGRMEADARPYRLEPLDIGRLVESVVEEFKQEDDTKDLILGFRVPKDGPSVNGDQDALAQALWNLLDNAVKYSDKRPDIQVDVEAGSCVAVRVRDQGIGIQHSERRRIFRKFVRGSSANMCGIKGTGIGLAMVKHIVDAHGGRVLVESEPGKGSTFTIQLPVGGKVDGKNSDR